MTLRIDLAYSPLLTRFCGAQVGSFAKGLISLACVIFIPLMIALSLLSYMHFKAWGTFAEKSEKTRLLFESFKEGATAFGRNKKKEEEEEERRRQEELMKDGWGNPVGPLPTASQDDDEDAAAKKKKEVRRQALLDHEPCSREHEHVNHHVNL